MKAGSVFSGWLMVCGIVAAFGAGYLLAKGFAGGPAGNDGDRTIRDARVADLRDKSWSHKVTGVKGWENVKNHLFERWEASPAMTMDFQLHEDTSRLLERLPLEDLEEWMRELRPEIHKDDDKNVPLVLRQMILMLLAQRGGGEFISSLAKNPLEDAEWEVGEAMDHWIRNDPSAVLAWLDGNDLPEIVAEDLDYYQEDALEGLIGKDLDEFERRLTGVDIETREDVLEGYAYRMGTAENRAGILERASRSPHGEAIALWEGLIWREASSDPKRGYATLAEIEIPAADRAKLDEQLVVWLMTDSLGYSMPKDKSGIMQDWVERHWRQPVPEQILSSFENWSKDGTKNAPSWVAQQPPGPQYDAFTKLMIDQTDQRSGEDQHELAAMAARISDPATRRDVNRRLKESWPAEDAAAAIEWEENLPASDLELLRPN